MAAEKENLKPIEAPSMVIVEPIEIPTKDDDQSRVSVRCMPKPPPKSSRSFYDLTKNDRTTIINYLAGERMSKSLESRALNELCSISPPESLIEALTPRSSPRKFKSPKVWCKLGVHTIALTQHALDKIESTGGGLESHFIFDVVWFADGCRDSWKFSSRIHGEIFNFVNDFGGGHKLVGASPVPF